MASIKLSSTASIPVYSFALIGFTPIVRGIVPESSCVDVSILLSRVPAFMLWGHVGTYRVRPGKMDSPIYLLRWHVIRACPQRIP